ncbi:MAG: hypothetical protein ACK5Z2_14730 [Bacteroidota bacterium]
MNSTTTDSSRWDVPRLLVPIDIQALVVSKAAQNYSWAWNALQYNNTGKFLDVVPSMFGNTKTPGTGITLHWGMPDGLTQGVQDESGNIVYPYVPNRWMVTRFWNNTSKSWVIQSDYIDSNNGANSFLNPNSTQPQATRIGKVWEIQNWPGETGVTQQNFLQAVGPGTTTFTAYVPGVNAVFSFYDSMSDLQSTTVPVTYMVAGWYGNPDDDPMLGTALFGTQGFQTIDEWKLVMNSLKWTVGNDTDIEQAINDWEVWAASQGIVVDPNNVRDIVPSQTLCQGMVYNVNWTGVNGAAQSGVPIYSKDTPADQLPMVAIANTSADALAALVQYELDLNGGTEGLQAAEFLEAFQYHQLNTYDEAGGQSKLYSEIFKAWFGSQDGQSVWLVRDPVHPDPPQLDETSSADLILLNQKALELDNAEHQLQDSRQNLYLLWWQQQKANTYWPGTYPPGITSAEWTVIKNNIAAAMPGAQAAVTTWEQSVAGLSAEVADLVAKLTAELSAPLVLEENKGGRYWHGNDPVVLVYGAHRSYRHGEDGRFDPDGYLFTRFSGQTVTGIQVQIPGYPPPEVNASNVTIPMINGMSSLFPPELDPLCIETYFLSTVNAQAIAQEAATLLSIPFDPSYTQIVITQQTSAWNGEIYKLDPQMVASVSGIVGVVPARIAVEPWAAPWSPLYLAWEITWYPSYSAASDAMQNWSFDNTNYEYQWNTAIDPKTNPPVTFSGNTLLTPKGTFAMKAELEAYLEETGEQPELLDFLEKVSNWDFLSQSISGFSDMMMGLSANQLNIPTEPTKSLVADQTQLSPVPDQLNSYFYPVRGGHFQISKLWVVDDFGQVFDPIAARGQTPQDFYPVIGTGMVTENYPSLVQLPPRITQPSRLKFTYSNSGATDTILDANGGENPVCGWILPNYLDKGVMVYSQDGTLLGELLLTGTTENTSLRFDYAPGINYPVGTQLADVVTNEYLRGFIEGLFAQTDPASSFKALLAVIDVSLWTINPLGGRNNEMTSVLIGRPLALVRASLEYNIMGGLQYSQQWEDAGLYVSEDYGSISLPVQIGNLLNPQDGTVGYFNGNNFNKFSTLVAGEVKSDPYIVNENVQMTLTGAQQFITLLLDPRGLNTAISGVLPLNTIVLPSVFVEAPMSNIEVTFRTGPLLVDPQQLRMPLPTEINGAWSWIQHSGVTTWETIGEIAQANQQSRFPDRLTLRDGWLQLSGLYDSETTEQS